MIETLQLTPTATYTGRTLWVGWWDQNTGKTYNGSGFVTYTISDYLAGATTPATETSPGNYQVTVPSSVAALNYRAIWYLQAAGAPAITDTPVGEGKPNAIGSGLSGSNAVTLTFHDAGGAPVPFAQYTVAGQGSGRADASGIAAIGLNNGTYTLTVAPTLTVLFPTTALTISGATSQTITGSAIVIAPPANPAQTTAYLATYDGQGASLAGVVINFELVDRGSSTGSFPRRKFTAASSGSPALLQVALLKSATYRAKRDNGDWITFTTDAGAAYPLPSILSGYGS